MPKRNLSDAVIGLLFAGLGTGIIVAASGLRTLPGMAVGSGLFPTITGAGMIIFGLVLAAQALFSGPGNGAEADESENTGFLSSYAVGMLVALAVLIVAMPRAGFMATGVVFAALIARMGGARWAGAVIFAAMATVGLYAVFVYGLRVPLPRGVLG